MTPSICSGVDAVTCSMNLPEGPLKAVTVRFEVWPIAVPIEVPPPTFEPLGHEASLAWIVAAEHVLNFVGLKTRFLSKWITASFVANATASFGDVSVCTVIFTLAGFFLVPAFVGFSLMLI